MTFTHVATGKDKVLNGPGFVVDTVEEAFIETSNVEGDNVINAAESGDGVTLTGMAQPGSSVGVTFKGVSRPATVDALGVWSVTNLPDDIPSGEYGSNVIAVAIDAYGNTATASGVVQIDTLVNALAFTSTFGGADGVFTAVEHADRMTVTGETESGSTVAVTFGDTTVDAVMAQGGTWTAQFFADQIATDTYNTDLMATATDVAGNTRSVTQPFTVD